MARARRAGRKSKRAQARINLGAAPADATPERLAKSEGSEFINPAEIDSKEQPIGRTRRFRDSWVDRMYRRGLLTYAQWFTCDWYRNLHAAAFTAQRVVADYGTGSGGAGSGNYGQAFNEAQQHHRKMYRRARDVIDGPMASVLENVILRDELPPFRNGQQRARFAMRFATAIQPLAEYIAAPGHQQVTAGAVEVDQNGLDCA